MATLSFRCREDRTNDDGLAPVDLRISHKSERRFLSTEIRVDPDKWRDGSVTRSHRQAAEINAGLRRIESTAQDALTSLQTSGARVTAERIKEAVQEALDPESDERVGFADFCEDRIQKMYDNGSTRKNHMTAVTKLREFLHDRRGVDDVPLSPYYVTASLLEEMQTWESEVRGNATNTIHKTMRTLRRMINVAIRDDLFPRSEYPFDDLTLSRERTGKTPLTSDQVQSLESLMEKIDDGEARFSPDGLPAHGLRAFLFSVYMLGMRWSDVSSLEWSQIRDGRVQYQMRKTGAQKDLKLVPPAKEILNWYDDRRGERFVFPLLERYAHKHDLSEDEGLRGAIEDMNRRINQELKKIDKAAGLGLGLTTHMARHTSAQRMMEQGWSLQEIQSALAHKSISTTEHYLRTVRDEELDEKHEDLW
ncbi:MAG: tyrosine-type recombinase/integrase [Salinibacter sp.]